MKSAGALAVGILIAIAAATGRAAPADEAKIGTRAGSAIDYKLWFSDTYVRTPGGWRYAFGQASIPVPKTPWGKTGDPDERQPAAIPSTR